MCNFGWRKLITFLLTFFLSLFLTIFLVKDEKPNQIAEKIIILPEKENRKCSEKILQEELNPIYYIYAELIQKRTEVKLWLQNNENVGGVVKNNQLTKLKQLEKQIVEVRKFIESSDQSKKKLKGEYISPQNLLYIEDCYEF